MEELIGRTELGQGDADRSKDIVQARAFQDNAKSPFFQAFAHPSGVLGRFAAFLMSRKNMALNRAAVGILDPAEGDSVLEIGFGPGKGLELLAERVGASGDVAGVDVSPQMVALASGRNMGALAGGSVRLVETGAHAVPWPDDHFHGILSVSNIQFWEPATASFHEVLRVLKPGGLLVAAIHTMREGQRKMTPGLYAEEINMLLNRLRDAGFEDVGTHRVSGLDNELCITASKSRG